MSTPNLKFELSPAESIAESFTSIPGQQYPSLFHTEGSMEPLQAMTPQSFDGDSMFGDDMGEDMGLTGSLAGTPAPEKKQVKKRKSWGQQLPEPKTNLPPRKRAKTEDEKEQRRVERVLRNRRAAQTSRERKRQEVDNLQAEKDQIERRNTDLQLQLADMQARYEEVRRKLEEVTGMAGENITPACLPPSSVTSTPSRKEKSGSIMTPIRDSHNTMQSAIGTVDLASVSPPPPSMESNDEDSFNPSSFVSTESTRALDEYPSEYSNFTGFGQYAMGSNDDFTSHLEYPDSLGADQTFFNERIGPIVDAFTNNFDNLATDNNGATNDALFADFIHQDEITPSAPEVHSSDSIVEETLNLQSQLGASSSGCDAGDNAVVV
ncbi:putative transcriptional activator hac1 protein [Botrytis fragariae]|uniref:Putative transcriptional activator hac1 protein n=1 Tax=Botrytis fragariae TaxID=1964551 RepID=A0A8H6B0I0_9HELO|nr:putative transcriptional activator hac1 protein [Botrytis fragariae]KAF5877134.1 putative transcriptional activator hac1 protein [Botrytis fragariae]